MNPDITTALSKLQFFTDNTPRSQQLDVAEFVHQSKRKFIAIEAPTGSGKSGMGMIVAMFDDNNKATYTVHSKNLQEQIEGEYPEVVVLMGRSNYECGYNSSLNGSQCTPSKSRPCTSKLCEYARQKAKCLAAKIKCLNYPYLFAEANYAGNQLGDADMVICDEADTIEAALSGFISLQVTTKMLKEYGLKLPKFKTADKEHKLLEWKEWAKMCAIKLAGLQRGKKSAYNSNTIPDDIQEEIDKMASTLMGFDLFQRNVDGSWLYEEDKRRYGTTHTFAPLWLTPELAKRFLWSYNKRWMFMSATLPPPETLCRLLGIPMAELDYMRVPSSFDPKHSPIYLTKSWEGRRRVDGVEVDFDVEIKKAVRDVNVILTKHVGQKGIIHTTSYKVRDAIMEGCQSEMSGVKFNVLRMQAGVSSDRLLTHNTSDRAAVLSDFMSSPYPNVLVSPSMARGVSLPHDKCRFSIMVKTPYESLGDKKVKKRLYDRKMNGQDWYRSVTAQNIIQAVGRAVRSEDDWCVNYMLDVSTYEFVFANVGLFSDYFRQCIVLGGADDWKGVSSKIEVL